MPWKAPVESLTLAELLSAYPDDAAAERLFVSRRWPDGITCPSCGVRTSRKMRPTRRCPFAVAAATTSSRCARAP